MHLHFKRSLSLSHCLINHVLVVFEQHFNKVKKELLPGATRREPFRRSSIKRIGDSTTWANAVDGKDTEERSREKVLFRVGR